MNGVQEVESSNLSTQTRKSPIFLEKSGFFVLEILCGLQRMSLCCQHGCQQIYLHGCLTDIVTALLRVSKSSFNIHPREEISQCRMSDSLCGMEIDVNVRGLLF